MKDIKIKGIFHFFNYIKYLAYFVPLSLIPLIFIHIFQKDVPKKEGYLTKTSEKFSFIFIIGYVGLAILILLIILLSALLGFTTPV